MIDGSVRGEGAVRGPSSASLQLYHPSIPLLRLSSSRIYAGPHTTIGGTSSPSQPSAEIGVDLHEMGVP